MDTSFPLCQTRCYQQAAWLMGRRRSCRWLFGDACTPEALVPQPPRALQGPCDPSFSRRAKDTV